MLESVVGDALVLDLLDRVPTPHGAHFGIGILEVTGVGEEFMRHHRGVMLERHGHQQVGDRRTALGQRQQLLDALVDLGDVVAGILGEPVEGHMLAGMVDFLADEGADLALELGIGAGAVGLDCFDEKGLAAREGRR